MRVMHNIPALQAYNALQSTNTQLQKSIERLSTGLRINSAADDAAGLAISEKMRAQIRGLDRATSNAQDGISMIQTAEGALGETHSILQRMRELSVQAANDTLTQEDRGYIQLEVDQLKEEITRIANTTQFNKKKLLDGSAAVLWSSDNLETKAIINGGLRQTDQFGQKAAVEGNFKLTINATPGQAEIKKTDIFKIKHKNVIMNLSLDKNNGFENIEVDNLPAGQYNVYQSRYKSSIAIATVNWTGYKRGATFANFASLDLGGVSASLAAAITAGAARDVDVTIAFTVTATNGLYYNGVRYASGSTVNAIMKIHIGSGVGLTAGVFHNFTSNGWSATNGLSVLNSYASRFSKVIKTGGRFNVATGGSYNFGGFYGLNSSTHNMTVVQSQLGGLQNASILMEVLNVNTATGEVTFRAQVNAMDHLGNLKSYVDDNLIIGKNGVAEGYNKLGFTFMKASAINISNATNYKAGDKLVLNTMSMDKAALNEITVSATINKSWPDSWGDPAKKQVSYRMDMGSLANKDVQFKHFYLNSANGKVYEGNVKVTFNNDVKTMSAGSTQALRASFEAAYIGQVAKSDVKLRDLDKFWDANGRFLLDDPKELNIYQGNGKTAKITLYATDTLEDVRKKLNDAIAYQLGQSQYVKTPEAEFVSFVDDKNKMADNPMSVEGTFVIRSLVPGSNGQLNFSGDEDLIKALSLNVIQEARENTFRVSVYDAHNAKNIASNVQITGNKLYGVVNANVDVEFDSMANINVVWNDVTKKFDLTKADGSYETILHLADNTTVFQIGANEGEDMGINIGDMSAHALGLKSILVTDRESAARSITIIDNAIGKVSTQRAKLGAYQNRLEHTINNLTTAATNTTAAESRIRDTDMAKEMMNFTKLNILSQAGNSMLAQANQLPQNVLSLLR